MGRSIVVILPTVFLFYVVFVLANGTIQSLHRTRAVAAAAARPSTLVVQGRRIFRYDTFGDQAFWGGALQLNRAIAGGKLGGVGPGVSPKTALSVGLKVDATKIPKNVVAAIKSEMTRLAK